MHQNYEKNMWNKERKNRRKRQTEAERKADRKEKFISAIIHYFLLLNRI